MRTHQFTGWQRLGIVLSVLWVLGVGGKAIGDYERVSSGGMPFGGFAVVKEVSTGKTYNKTREEVLKLTTQEGHIVFLNEATAVTLKIAVLSQVLVLPLLFFWAAFFTLRWVVAGFRKPTSQGAV